MLQLLGKRWHLLFEVICFLTSLIAIWGHTLVALYCYCHTVLASCFYRLGYMHMWCICRMQRTIHPHTHTSQSVLLCSLPQPNCAEDLIPAIACHKKPTQTPLHNYGEKKAKRPKQLNKQETHKLTLAYANTSSSSCSLAQSRFMLCPVPAEKVAIWHSAVALFSRFPILLPNQ